jgi:hypothetical protein
MPNVLRAGMVALERRRVVRILVGAPHAGACYIRGETLEKLVPVSGALVRPVAIFAAGDVREKSLGRHASDLKS